MPEVFRPADATAALDVVTWAAAERKPLEIVAGGSKRGLGRPARTAHVLDLSALSGIIDYDPSELVLTAHAATPMAVIAEQLATNRQMLAFEPPDWRALLGDSGEPTLGGTIACNMAGPRRIRAGAARDHFLGFAAINGWGDAWKAGGRVVKNVTGYDLCKLQAGAYGTLSVLTEITVRVLPRPETACTLLVHGLEDAAAIAAMATALNTPHEVTAAAHVPGGLAARLDVPGVDGTVTALRLDGHRPSVEYRAGALGAQLRATARLEAADTARFWAAVGAVRPFVAEPARAVWRICPTPSAAAALVRRVRARHADADAFYDWAGGLVWLSIDATGDCGAAAVRAAVADAGGHATLIRAPEHVRETVPVFEPLDAPLTALTRRVKASFDPQGILNPGRMQDGI